MPLEPDETQSEQVNSRISEALLQRLDACAAEEGRTRSQMIRRMIEEGVRARQGGRR